eukprot:TRINITY_DN7540_c0_g1_i1.p1 TRINITY_DN7540_c0_g1~~TRINITY_DN7540_c0_g1_i1.p1  ORF type:complete len:311 (+),score=37.28 TRINITY_DN7540_c0_g1_i1:153-1085(+)
MELDFGLRATCMSINSIAREEPRQLKAARTICRPKLQVRPSGTILTFPVSPTSATHLKRPSPPRRLLIGRPPALRRLKPRTKSKADVTPLSNQPPAALLQRASIPCMQARVPKHTPVAKACNAPRKSSIKSTGALNLSDKVLPRPLLRQASRNRAQTGTDSESPTSKYVILGHTTSNKAGAAPSPPPGTPVLEEHQTLQYPSLLTETAKAYVVKKLAALASAQQQAAKARAAQDQAQAKSHREAQAQAERQHTMAFQRHVIRTLNARMRQHEQAAFEAWQQAQLNTEGDDDVGATRPSTAGEWSDSECES